MVKENGYRYAHMRVHIMLVFAFTVHLFIQQILLVIYYV